MEGTNEKTLSNIGDLEPSDLSELVPEEEKPANTEESLTSSSSDVKIIKNNEEDTIEPEQVVDEPNVEATMDVLEEASNDAPSLPKEEDNQEDNQEKEIDEEEPPLPDPLAESTVEPMVEPITTPTLEEESNKLNTFYYLKNKYEEDKHDRCNKKILGNEKLSLKLKRQQFLLCKPKCINCRRRVGSVFTIRYSSVDDNKYRQFIGKCGDPTEPCEFNIDLRVPIVQRVDEEYKASIQRINYLQSQVILAKNEAVFGIIKPEEAIDAFENLKTELNSTSVMMEQYLNKLIDVVNNKEKKEELARKLVEFNQNIDEFKTKILKHTEEDLPVKIAIEYFKDTILPALEEITRLKYAVREVVDDKFKKVVSQESTVEQLEIIKDLQVISFNVGKNTHTPDPIVPPASKTKTNKNKGDAKNKTVRKKQTNIPQNITTIMVDIFQNMILEDKLSSATASSVYKLMEEQYQLPDVKNKYGDFIKNYLKTNIQEWLNILPVILKTIQEIANEGIPRKELASRMGDQVDLKKYNRVINEIFNRYDNQLDSDPTIPKPLPIWPDYSIK